ncbi:MAG: thioredoxin family protein [Arenicellales bacterium]
MITRSLMKLTQTMLLSLLAAISLTTHAAVNVGQPAPDFTGADSNGKQHSLSQYKGKTVVLEWTNHDCPYVKKHYNSGNMQALQKDATANGVVWLSIISSRPGKQGHVSGKQANKLTASRNASPTAVILDESSEIGLLYGAKTTPHMYIVDKSGQLVYMGGIDNTPSKDEDDIPNSKNYVRAALDEMAAGQAIKESITRPYGCSVKY